MSDRRGNGRRATATIPLFPLRAVLYPGALLPLKVFEQRYIAMTAACLRDDRAFGVVMITAGAEVATGEGPPALAGVGTYARIASVDRSETGVLHVAARGLARFQVRDYRVDSDRLIVAEVADIPPEPALPVPDDAAPLVRLLGLMAARVGPRQFPAQTRYDDASWVGYRLAELLPLPLAIKQSLLEINDAAIRLEVLGKFLAQQGIV